jgi:SM-20-related protein
MIDLTRANPQALVVEPYKWAFIDGVFSRPDGESLVKTFPRDHFKTIEGYDGEKGYRYEARSLVAMGANAPSRAECLSLTWQRLTGDLLAPGYREALSHLTGMDLSGLPMEVNIFHYGRSAWLGPHVDLEDKVLTHVFYFNLGWNERDGGCLTILRSGDMTSAVTVIPPLVGNSVVLVRSDNSWHAVSRVRDKIRTSRRSMVVTFYRTGSPSTMWPEGDSSLLHDYTGEHVAWSRWLRQKWHRVVAKVRDSD